jgi:hypothetical protein
MDCDLVEATQKEGNWKVLVKKNVMIFWETGGFLKLYPHKNSCHEA